MPVRPLGARIMRSGREVVARYTTDRRTWHKRLVLEFCDGDTLERIMGEAPGEPDAEMM